MCPWGDWQNRPRQRPRWWPEEEPWPPQGPPRMWRRMRHRFLWRIGLAFLILWLLAFAFFGFIGWYAGARFGGGLPHGGPPPFVRPFGFLLFLLLVFGLIAAARSLRRMAVPVGGLMEAAGQLAEGHYDVRVREWGSPEARALARAFNRMAERLQTDEQQRRNLLADVTHELRTPLAVIQGNLEGLLDGVYPRDEAHLTPILEEAKVLSTLIEDLRTLALAETGTLELQREPTDVEALVKETVAAFRPQAEANGVTFAMDIPDDLPTLEIDATRIRQVLSNLLSNALQHTPQGGTVRIACDAGTARQPPEVTVTVSDTGRGMASDDLPHVFDRFYRSKASRGSGLGLAIARNLVTLHGGHIAAESTVGRGTTVRFTLPYRR